MDLRPYQVEAIHRLINNPRYVLGWEMGMGKTATILTALRVLNLEPVVVVAPANVARGVWPDESLRWGGLPAVEVKRAADIRCGQINSVSFGQLTKPEWASVKPGVLVIDELTFVKNWNRAAAHGSARAVNVAKMADNAQYVWGMTGSLVPEGLIDLWGMMAVLAPDALGRKKGSFRETYMLPRQRGDYVVWENRDGAVRAVADKLDPYVWSLTSEDVALDLPEHVDQIVPVYLSEKRMAEYKRMEKTHAAEGVTALNAASVSMKLRQMTAGWLHDTETDEWHELGREKLDAMMTSPEKPKLVMTQFRPEMARIISEGGVKLDASRQAEWNSGMIDLAVAHPASAGHGLNLQHGGSHLHWQSLPWSAEQWAQAYKRLHRPGQTAETVFNHIYVVKSTADVAVLRALMRKSDVQEEFIRWMRGSNG